MVLPIQETIPDEGNFEAIQTAMARKLLSGDQFRYIAGVALSFSEKEDTAFVVATVVSTSNWKVINDQRKILPVSRENVPGLENFREGPLMLEALTHLAMVPDLIFVEGHGIAHPRKFGVASHVGLALNLPTIGVADLWPPGCDGGTAPALPSALRGNRTALFHMPSHDIVGHVVRTQNQEAPVYVSPGHRVSPAASVDFVLRCSPWYRYPESLRIAKEIAQDLRVKAKC